MAPTEPAESNGSNTVVTLSPDVTHALSEAGSSLNDLLERTGLKGAQVAETNLPSPQGGRGEPVTVILASAAVIAALTPALKSLIEAIFFRPVVINNRELVAIVDKDGEVLRDKDGSPIIEYRDNYKMLQPRLPASASHKIVGKSPVLEVSFEQNPKE